MPEQNAVEIGVDRLWASYLASVETYAQHVLTDKIAPILNRHGWSLYTGMGTFSIENDREVIAWYGTVQLVAVRQYQRGDLQELYEMLMAPVHGSDVCLANYMPDYETG